MAATTARNIASICRVPDITGSELAQLFDKFAAEQQLIVNATSASGATIDLWKRPERIVITATKSGGERTATRFAQFWAQAVTGDGADVNKDEVVTAEEAYDFANRQVAESFKSDVALATEHARMAADENATFLVARISGSAVCAQIPKSLRCLRSADRSSMTSPESRSARRL